MKLSDAMARVVSGGDVRILLVEDEELVRLILAEALADYGYQVVEAATGDEAARLFEQGAAFDAVVTDINMPGSRDGIALGRYARDRDPTIPIIYVTGRPDARSAVGPLGPRDAFMAKPYAPSEVAATLDRLLPPDRRQQDA